MVVGLKRRYHGQMEHTTLLFAKHGHVAWITLNHPENGNILNETMVRELAEVCSEVNADRDIYAVLLSGAGDAFCRGSEAASRVELRPADALAGIECAVIAAINGDAIGPGLELALAADIRLAATGARLGLPQVSEGLIPADGGTQRLPRIVGRGKALEMLLTADIITTEEAAEIGLVNRAVPGENLMAEADGLAGEIAAKGPLALRYLKEAVNKGSDMTLEQGLRLEADLYFLLHTTSDRTEGIRAFLEKRSPEFTGN